MTDIPIVTKPAAESLTSRKLTDYRAYKQELIQWLTKVGKDPQTRAGYADDTVRNVSYHLDRFYRWRWANSGYTLEITPTDAEQYIKHLVFSDKDYSDTYLDIATKCLKRVFKFWNHSRGKDYEWESDYSFTTQQDAPRDYLTTEERQAIREAALELGSIPAYGSLSAEERDRWKAVLAQRFEKPKEDITQEDWKRANGWKIPSMVWVSLDTGLRPIEVGRAKIYWVDTQNKVLRIPKEESSKNEGNWTVAISDRTAEALKRWLIEREQQAVYDESESLWLTKYGNPYGSHSLRRMLHRLCEVAGIEYEHRQMSWYTIRHSVGTYMTREEDLAAAKSQLRHKSAKTTMKYDQAPVEDRRDALDKMG